jgi:hypothetical protein
MFMVGFRLILFLKPVFPLIHIQHRYNTKRGASATTIHIIRQGLAIFFFENSKGYVWSRYCADVSETQSLFLMEDNSLTLPKEFLPVLMVFIEKEGVWPYAFYIFV